MKVLVAVKRVADHKVKVRPTADDAGVETAYAEMSMNPFDGIAVEEAVRRKEAGDASEVVVVSLGEAQSQKTIRQALAMGADRGILIKCAVKLQPLALAKCLKAVVEREEPGLVFLGKQAADAASNQIGQMLAALLGWPQGTFASNVVVGDGKVQLTREIEGSLETMGLDLPAVVTTDLRLNEPRCVKLPNIMEAKEKPLETFTPEVLGIDVKPRLTTSMVTKPPVRQAGMSVEHFHTLIDKLEHEETVV